ncbi:MAG: PAS domain S-box protein [Polyangiaceae bacterium]
MGTNPIACASWRDRVEAEGDRVSFARDPGDARAVLDRVKPDRILVVGEGEFRDTKDRDPWTWCPCPVSFVERPADTDDRELLANLRFAFAPLFSFGQGATEDDDLDPLNALRHVIASSPFTSGVVFGRGEGKGEVLASFDRGGPSTIVDVRPPASWPSVDGASLVDPTGNSLVVTIGSEARPSRRRALELRWDASDPQVSAPRMVRLARAIAREFGIAMVREESRNRANAEVRRARTFLENALEPVFITGSDGRIVDVNRAGAALHGVPRERIVGLHFTEIVEEENREEQKANFERLSRDGSTRVVARTRRLSDGELVVVEASTSLVVLEGESYAVVVVRDVTERRAVDERLRSSEERFRTVVDSIDDVVCTLDVEGRYSATFGKGVLAFGATWEEMVGRTYRDVFGGEDAEAHEAAIRGALEGRSVTYETSFGNGNQGPNFHTVNSPLHDGDHRIVGLVTVSRDISEMKRVQAQLFISDRMASIGMLAAGVAHEINNPLAAVLSNLELAATEAADLAGSVGAVELSNIVDEVADARVAASRVREIVRDLRMFSRSDAESPAPIDVGQALDSAARMAWNEVRHRARLVKDYADLPKVLANEGRLGQVFLNLIVNAAHAIPEGRASANEIRLVTRVDAQGRVVVNVEDTGSGIPAEVMPKLFRPFFTTKPVGVGTGLGLSICQRIVTAIGGDITVTSELGRGTSFQVRLPPASASIAPATTIPKAGPPTGRRGRVLVVDDEPLVCSVIRRSLATEHEVTTCANGRQALALLEGGARFDVILCDLMMPEMTGMELFDSVLDAFPDQAEQVIFVTGGAFTTRARSFLEARPNPYLDKPFDPEVLRRVVREKVGPAEATP